MSTERRERLSSTMKKILGEIMLRELRDPRLRALRILAVDLSPDYRQVRVTFSGGDPREDEVIFRQLEQARGFIRKNLARRMILKKVPALHFSRGNTESPKAE